MKLWNGGGDKPLQILKATIHPQHSNSSSTKVLSFAPASFYSDDAEGYAFGPHDPLLPEYYIAINGFFPNGTKFATTLPAISGKVTTSHEEVTGTWSGAGAFKGSADLSTFTVTLNAPSAGFEGTVKLTSNAGHHFGCNSTTDPYFSTAIPSGTKLSAAETLLYTQLGWATTIPGMYQNGHSLHYVVVMIFCRCRVRCQYDDQWVETPFQRSGIP
jgi:hypothetical protein